MNSTYVLIVIALAVILATGLFVGFEGYRRTLGWREERPLVGLRVLYLAGLSAMVLIYVISFTVAGFPWAAAIPIIGMVVGFLAAVIRSRGGMSPRSNGNHHSGG